MPHRHAGLPRAFDLSPMGYFLDFALVPAAAIALLIAALLSGASLVSIAIDVVAGVWLWTLAEYLIHRFVFHGPTVFEPMHQMHHALPKEMIGVASWATFAGFAAVWLIFGGSFAAGFMLGYLFYCVIHVRFHHHRAGAKLSRYVAFMNAHHVAHHRGGKGNFGVSSPIWDFVFRTYRPPNGGKLSCLNF